MGVNCLAQEHNAVPRPVLQPGPSDPESSALTIRPPRLPRFHYRKTLLGGLLKQGLYLGQIQVFIKGGLMKGRGVLGHPPPEHFRIFNPWKCDLQQSEAKSACFNFSFYKVKIPLFLH